MKNILVVSDQKPGHYNQSYGVVAALKRLEKFQVTEKTVGRIILLPRRISEILLKWHWFPIPLHLLLAGIYRPAISSRPDIIVSAGGRTLIANVLLAKKFGVPNIFSGSIRGIDKHSFCAIAQIYPEFEGVRPYVVGLKPSPVEFVGRSASNADPQQICLLIGGPTAAHSFTATEFDRLCSGLADSRLRWKVISSRRTPPNWSKRLNELQDLRNIEVFDSQKTGPMNIFELIKDCDAAIVTADSTSMISESIATGLPVISLTSEDQSPTRDDDYLVLLQEQGWFKMVAMQSCSDANLLSAIKACKPSTVDHTELLSKALGALLSEQALKT